MVFLQDLGHFKDSDGNNGYCHQIPQSDQWKEPDVEAKVYVGTKRFDLMERTSMLLSKKSVSGRDHLSGDFAGTTLSRTGIVHLDAAVQSQEKPLSLLSLD